MALAQPYDVKMSDSEFIKRAKKVQEWFSPLSPYKGDQPLFKIEDVNYKLSGRNGLKKIEKLFCFAVSAKRYALFNTDDSNRPIIRKASAHGLGHLLPPYEENDTPANIPKPAEALSKIGVARWQHDFWYQIITSALNGHPGQINFAALHNINNVAVNRYAATSPDLLRWFKMHNANREYSEQVKPFNFLLSFYQRPAKVHLSPIAPFDKDHCRAVKLCFDRNTGESIRPEDLKTYLETLAQYHLHPEAKFDNGNYTDIGTTKRKHIYATAIEHIGKEANRLEDQWYLGHDPEAQTVYRLPKKDFEKLAAVTIREARKYRQRELARASGYSLREVSRLICGEVAATPQSIARLQSAINTLEKEKQETAETLSRAKQASQKLGLRKFASQAGIDPANLYKTLMGKRRPSAESLAKLQHILSESD
jgi:transcriptional regulator with XRE-family HTH domain